MKLAVFQRLFWPVLMAGGMVAVSAPAKAYAPVSVYDVEESSQQVETITQLPVPLERRDRDYRDFRGSDRRDYRFSGRPMPPPVPPVYYDRGYRDRDYRSRDYRDRDRDYRDWDYDDRDYRDRDYRDRDYRDRDYRNRDYRRFGSDSRHFLEVPPPLPFSEIPPPFPPGPDFIR